MKKGKGGGEKKKILLSSTYLVRQDQNQGKEEDKNKRDEQRPREIQTNSSADRAGAAAGRSGKKIRGFLWGNDREGDGGASLSTTVLPFLREEKKKWKKGDMVNSYQKCRLAGKKRGMKGSGHDLFTSD